MKLRVTIVLIVSLVGLMFWLTSTRRTGQFRVQSSAFRVGPPGTRNPELGTRSPEGNPEVPEEPTNSSLPGPVAAKPKAVTLAALEEPPTAPEPGEAGPVLAPATALENMRTVFRQYAMRFGGNPVGSNREITAALNGQNPRQVVFLNPDDGLPVNARGELVDNWGTPYFFHQLSGTEMEIHSAGPDRKMWTSDDLVTK